ncbi:MAG: HEAT repeat domain-containing protein [Planctomycetota bacterium]
MLLGCLAAAACREAASAGPGPLPPVALTSKLPHFEELARLAPAPPEEAALKRSLALLEPALLDLGDARLKAKSHAALLDDPLVGPVLEAGLDHDDAAIRASAAYELGKLDRPAALIPLLKRLKYEQDKTVRIWIADALLRRGCGCGADELLTALRDPNTKELAGERATDQLQAIHFTLPERITWEALATGLERLQERWHAVGKLRDDAPTLDDATRGRVATLICQLEGFQLRPVDEARYMLAHAGALALPQLREAIGASEHYLRIHSLEVLRDLGVVARDLTPDVLPLLRDELSRTDAANALAAMRAPAAVPHMLAWLRASDNELRTVAAHALGLLGDRRAEPELRARQQDENESLDVRVMAAFALAMFEIDRPAYRFLTDLRARGDYHEARLSDLIDQIDKRR